MDTIKTLVPPVKKKKFRSNNVRQARNNLLNKADIKYFRGIINKNKK